MTEKWTAADYATLIDDMAGNISILHRLYSQREIENHELFDIIDVQRNLCVAVQGLASALKEMVEQSPPPLRVLPPTMMRVNTERFLCHRCPTVSIPPDRIVEIEGRHCCPKHAPPYHSVMH